MNISGLPQNTVDLLTKILLKFKPPEEIDMSEWADKYRKLPPESSSEPGQWKTSQTPYLKKIMDLTSDDSVRKVVIMSSVQIGKSELLLNAMGYYSHIDPSSILLVQPTVDAGRNFSKERIAPTIRDTPILRKIFGVEKSRDSKNTVMKKFFPGGYIAIVGANSPVGLASRPIKILLADEIDRWPESAKKEGDPLSIVEKRTTTFPYSCKMVYTSTPTIDGFSRIQREFLQGSMEEWKLPCPGCGKYQLLEWADIVLPRDEEAGQIDLDKDILCVCRSCGELFNEVEWKSGSGEWFPANDNIEIKSFHLNALVSPWKSWKTIAASFLASKDDAEMLKVWTNTELGDVWIEPSESVDTNDLIRRRERYSSHVPDGVLVITAGIDVQDDRFECEIVGWGENKTSWGIEYKVIIGDTSQPEAWENLDMHLSKMYKLEDGAQLPISTACIDSGGHRTTECYRFCKENESRGIYAIKGKGGSGMNVIHSHSRTKRIKNLLFIVATDTAKALLFSRLSLTDDTKAGYCHFPISDSSDDSSVGNGYDEKFFDGLTSEVKVTKFVKGKIKTEWKVKSGVRNEPLDCRVYNIAAVEILNPNFEEIKKRRTARPAKKRGRMISRGVDFN